MLIQLQLFSDASQLTGFTVILHNEHPPELWSSGPAPKHPPSLLEAATILTSRPCVLPFLHSLLGKGIPISTGI